MRFNILQIRNDSFFKVHTEGGWVKSIDCGSKGFRNLPLSYPSPSSAHESQGKGTIHSRLFDITANCRRFNYSTRGKESRLLTCQCGAVLGKPFRSHSRLWRCHWAAATKTTPKGVQRRMTPCHDSQPPAANNHQSKTDKIVQPAPAPQRHFRLILCNLPLPFWLLDWYCGPCDFEKGRLTIVHLGVHCFGRKFVAFVILNKTKKEIIQLLSSKFLN